MEPGGDESPESSGGDSGSEITGDVRDDAAYLDAICRKVVSSGLAWISTASIGSDARPVLRACITNYRTGPKDIAALVEALEQARHSVGQG